MNEYREAHDEAREHGLEQRHRFRLEMAVRREVAEEIAQAIETFFPDPHTRDEECSDCILVEEFAKMAREIGARNG